MLGICNGGHIHNDEMETVIIPFYRWENQGPERFRLAQPQVTQLVHNQGSVLCMATTGLGLLHLVPQMWQ
jgi:hypothetical protein